MICAMPTYEYRCHDCETVFDYYQSFDDDSVPKCPGKSKNGPYECTKPRKGKVTKIFGNVGISFKGSGFYKNDHAAKKKKSASADSAAASSTPSTGSDSSSNGSKTADSSSKSDSSKSSNTKGESKTSTTSKD